MCDIGTLKVKIRSYRKCEIIIMKRDVREGIPPLRYL